GAAMTNHGDRLSLGNRHDLVLSGDIRMTSIALKTTSDIVTRNSDTAPHNIAVVLTAAGKESISVGK
ncbi:MAG: hypothetical protein ACTSWM_07010, partial [Alphaproteobacteria bacterium]